MLLWIPIGNKGRAFMKYINWASAYTTQSAYVDQSFFLSLIEETRHPADQLLDRKVELNVASPLQLIGRIPLKKNVLCAEPQMQL